MNEEKRVTQGYQIIESCKLGAKELVIGYSNHAPSPYVCWYCKNHEDYYWGYYCNTLQQAQANLSERCQDELRHLHHRTLMLHERKDSHER